MRIIPLSLSLSLLLLATLYARSVLAQSPHASGRSRCATTGAASVAESHKEWILVGWEKAVPGQPWDFREKIGKFYDWAATDVVLYDTMAPEHRVARSAEQYRALFEPMFQSMRRANHRVLDGPDTIVSGDLATSTLEFAARLEPLDKPVMSVRARSTLVWRCTPNGWRIVREHNSTREITPAESCDIFGI